MEHDPGSRPRTHGPGPFLFGLVGFSTGLVAWLTGKDGRRAIHKGRLDFYGRELVLAGWVSGMVGIVLGASASMKGLVSFLLTPLD